MVRHLAQMVCADAPFQQWPVSFQAAQCQLMNLIVPGLITHRVRDFLRFCAQSTNSAELLYIVLFYTCMPNLILLIQTCLSLMLSFWIWDYELCWNVKTFKLNIEMCFLWVIIFQHTKLFSKTKNKARGQDFNYLPVDWQAEMKTTRAYHSPKKK